MAIKQNSSEPPMDLPTIHYRVGIVEGKVEDVETDIKSVKENYVKKTDGKFIRNIGVLIVTTFITVLVTLFAKFIFSGGLN